MVRARENIFILKETEARKSMKKECVLDLSLMLHSSLFRITGAAFLSGGLYKGFILYVLINGFIGASSSTSA